MKSSSSAKAQLLWGFVFFLLFNQDLTAQTEHYPCAASEMQRVLFDQNPALLQQQKVLDQTLQEHLQRQGHLPALRGAAVFTIPVVVHIVHQNGTENISDAQVQAAIQHLNDAFAHQGYYAQKGAGTNIPIQFCLAQRDPNNQATNGVTRDESPLTTMTLEKDDSALKKISRWDAKQYLNIWVVRDIGSTAFGASVAGYAYLASAHGLSMDGLVCEAGFFGNSPANDIVLIHEIGHYFNLYHTFEGGCSNSNCELEGDRICDTPPDQAKQTGCVYNSCTTDADDTRPVNPLKTDGNDMTENYMDYSPFSCQHAFTPGQADRMLAALQTIRFSLLDSPGCLPPCSQNIVADISIPSKIVIGTPAIFTFSGSGASQFNWSLNGNGFSTQQNSTYTFTQIGNYNLELVVRNNDANCWARKQVMVKVECNASAEFTPRSAEVQLGDQFTFNSTGAGISSYEWSIDGTVVGIGKMYTHTFKSYGDYLLQLKVSNGNCSSTTAQRISVQSPCGDFIQQYSYNYNLPAIARHFKLAENGDLMAGGWGSFDGEQSLILKWNANDELEWIKREINTGWKVWDLAPITDGNWVYIKYGTDPRLIELTKINTKGDLIWNRRFRLEQPRLVPQTEKLTSLEKTNGFLMVQDNYLIRFDQTDKIVWGKTWKNGRIGSAAQRSDGKILVIAEETSSKVFVLLMDDQGRILKQIALAWNDGNIISMFIDDLSDNGAMIRVKAENATRLLKLDANLVPAWGKELPFDRFKGGDVVVSKNDDIIFPFWNRDNGKMDGIALNKHGKHLWNIRIPQVSWSTESYGVPYLDGWKIFVNDSIYTAPTKDIQLKIPNLQFPQGCFFRPAPAVLIKDFLPSIVSNNFVFSDFLVEEIPAPTISYEDFQSTRETECRIANPCPEICNNQIDDNEDGLTDCEDPTCQCIECQRLPDGVISKVDSIQCQGDSLRVWLKICNQGQALLRANTPIAFYNADPTLTNASPLAAVLTLGVDLPVDSCISLDFIIRAPGSNPIFVMLNDNYQRPRPYNLDRYRVEGTSECSYLNNKTQFNYDPAPVPQLYLGPDQLVCANSVTVLHATAGFARYRWFDGSTDITLTVFSPGTYWLDAWDACGNIHSDSIHLRLQPFGQIALGPDRSICAGDTLHLAVTGFSQINWWPQQGLNCDTCRNIVIKPDTTTRYYLTARQGNCFAGDSILIQVNKAPVISLASPDTLTCTRSQVQLELTTPAPPKIQWYNSSGQLLNGSNPTITRAGWYRIWVADSSGTCSTQDSVEVLQGTVPPKVDLGADQILCSGSSLQIMGPLLPALRFQWSTGATTPSITVTQNGDYALEVRDGAGCTALDTVKITFSPPFTFDLGFDTTICIGAVLRLPVKAIDADSYRWSTGAQSAVIEVNKAGWYVLEGAKDNCSWRDSIQVTLEACKQFAVYVPNAMSPSSTVNQQFHPFFDQKTEILTYQFYIYDRWGEMIFHSEDRQESWDGTKKGKKCLQGEYVWTLRVRYRENGQEKEAFKVGEVLLLR